jgi:hypothetical protein
MPDNLYALLFVTICAGILPSLYLLFYRLYLKIAYDKAEGKVLSREESIKRIKFKGFKREDVEDLPLKAFIEFETSEGTLTVESLYEYDNEEYERNFPSNEVIVLYDHKHPDKSYILSNEFKRRFIKVSLGFAVFALLAVGAEFTAFIYLGMI